MRVEALDTSELHLDRAVEGRVTDSCIHMLILLPYRLDKNEKVRSG